MPSNGGPIVGSLQRTKGDALRQRNPVEGRRRPRRRQRHAEPRYAAEDQFTSTRARLTELGGSFKGQTATAFDAKAWRTSAKQLLEALNGLAEFLDTTANTIEQVDADIANQLKG